MSNRIYCTHRGVSRFYLAGRGVLVSADRAAGRKQRQRGAEGEEAVLHDGASLSLASSIDPRFMTISLLFAPCFPHSHCNSSSDDPIDGNTRSTLRDSCPGTSTLARSRDKSSTIDTRSFVACTNNREARRHATRVMRLASHDEVLVLYVARIPSTKYVVCMCSCIASCHNLD